MVAEDVAFGVLTQVRIIDQREKSRRDLGRAGVVAEDLLGGVDDSDVNRIAVVRCRPVAYEPTRIFADASSTITSTTSRRASSSSLAAW